MSATPTFGRRGVASTPALRTSAPVGSQPIFRDASETAEFVWPGTDRSAKSPARGGSETRGLVWLLFSFDGRLRRMSYWLGKIGVLVSLWVITAMSRGVGAALKAGQAGHAASFTTLAAALIFLMVLLLALGAAVWSSLALVVKRWHDRGRSGLWALLGFVPLAGWLWQGIECGFLDGTLGPNAYGPSPKGVTGVMYGDSLAETFS